MRLISIVLFAAVLAGCAGTKFSFQQASKVQVGMSESEVIGIMGRPYSVVSLPDSQRWVWSYANGFSGNSRSVSMEFRNGKVSSVPNIPGSFTGAPQQAVEQATGQAEIAPVAGELTKEQYKKAQIDALMRENVSYEEYQRRLRLIEAQ